MTMTFKSLSAAHKWKQYSEQLERAVHYTVLVEIDTCPCKTALVYFHIQSIDKCHFSKLFKWLDLQSDKYAMRNISAKD